MDMDLLLILSFSSFMVIGYPIARAIARRLTARLDQPQASLPSDLSVRLDRLEHLAEATQIEVERLAEGQRFTTKLLSERPPVVERRVDDTARG